MFTLNCKGRLLVLDKPIVMGIINVTPDSFYASSRKQNISDLVTQAEQMINDGATILDIGGQSTRPGSAILSEDEELNRVVPAISAISEKFPQTILSVDTYYAKVADEAVAAGASMVNDISGGTFDKKMISVVAGLGVPYVLMHIKGIAATMHEPTVYDDLLRELLDFFITRTDTLKKAGIKDIIIDPGFGFSKSIAQNFELLGKLEMFQILNLPLLTGLSRKSTIYKTLDITADEALNGTTVLNTICLMKGAGILRVHDVKEAGQAIELVTAVGI